MQRSGPFTVIDQYKNFYARPMEQMVQDFLQSKHNAYEDLMRRIRHSKFDKALLSLYITTHYTSALGNHQKLKELTAAELTLLGLAYENAWGVEGNFSEAYQLYMLAAKKKNATALLRLGWLYEKGAGVDKRNYKEAEKYYLQAKDQGSASALVRLGELYLKNKRPISSSSRIEYMDIKHIMEFTKIFGRPYNVTADQYFTAARLVGNIEMLVRYIRHLEVPEGPLRQFCIAAASSGEAGCLIQLGAALIKENILWYKDPHDYSPQELSALSAACLCFEMVLDQGNIAGLAALYWARQKGGGDKTYYEKIISSAQKFLEAGECDAAYHLGRLYAKGVEVSDFSLEKNVSLAAHYFRIAAESSRYDIREFAREHLLRLCEDTNDLEALYHQCLYPVSKYRQGLARETNREDFYNLAKENPKLFHNLVQRYKDTWGKVMLLFDPQISITPGIETAFYILCNTILPPEMILYIFGMLHTPNLLNVLFIKNMMYDELDDVINIRLAILSRKWIREGHEQQCDATLKLKGKDQKQYVKKIPAAEKNKWEICVALRNGSALFSVKEGLNRIKLIEQPHSDLYQSVRKI